MHDLFKKSVDAVHFNKKDEVISFALQKRPRSFEKAALVFLRITQAACILSILIVVGFSVFTFTASGFFTRENPSSISIDNNTPFAFIRYASLIEEKCNEN